MESFTWGKVVKVFTLDFDGKEVEITKYHPWKSENCRVLRGTADEATILYHCEELHASFSSFNAVILAWMVYKSLGLNQFALVSGLCRAINIQE